MKPKVDLLLTYDYELFLGNVSGCVEKCMIKPTHLLSQLMRKYKLHGIFFVDTTYLLRLNEIKDTNKNALVDFNKIFDQLNALLESGHYIFPHIHPHWLDAEYIQDINQWKLINIKHYRADSLQNDTLEMLFDKSIELLKTNLPKTKDPNYSWAYRAGGWCIQPFKLFETSFKKHKIVADFSVLAGQKVTNEAIKIDFKNLPATIAPYRFNSIESLPEKNGNFIEFPISSIVKPNIQKSRFSKLRDSLLWHLKISKGIGDGIGADFGNTQKDYFGDLPLEMISIELLDNKVTLDSYLEFAKTNKYIHFISHPKMISRFHLLYLDRFFNHLSNNSYIESDWKNMFPETTVT